MCDNGFTDMAAEAICRDMNYVRAHKWTSNIKDIDYDYDFYRLRFKYDIKLDDVSCQTPDWESCTYTFYFDWDGGYKTDGVFLSCQGNEREY